MANENLTLHLKVKDFAAWRTSYNGHEKERTSAGITNSKVFRSADDQNDVVILADAADVAKVRTWGLERNEDGDGEERRPRHASDPVCRSRLTAARLQSNRDGLWRARLLRSVA